MIGVTITPSHIDYSKILDDKAIENIIMGECIVLRSFAVELAPIKDGQLKNSIMWKTSKNKGSLNQGEGGKLHTSEISDPPENEGYVGSNLEYAGPVEYGRRDMKNYPRQPYLRPAVDYSKPKREARRKKIINLAIKAAYHG
jgi:phage gpG-like protein